MLDASASRDCGGRAREARSGHGRFEALKINSSLRFVGLLSRVSTTIGKSKTNLHINLSNSYLELVKFQLPDDFFLHNISLQHIKHTCISQLLAAKQ